MPRPSCSVNAQHPTRLEINPVNGLVRLLRYGAFVQLTVNIPIVGRSRHEAEAPRHAVVHAAAVHVDRDGIRPDVGGDRNDELSADMCQLLPGLREQDGRGAECLSHGLRAGDR